MLISTRDARPGDIDAIVEIWKDYMELLHHSNPVYWRLENPEDSFRDHLEHTFEKPEVRLLVAQEGRSRIAGFTLCHMECLPEWFGARPIGFIRYMAVAPEFRRHGVGRKMTVETVRWFAGAGISRVELFVLNGIEAASFWEKMGFSSFMDRRFLEI